MHTQLGPLHAGNGSNRGYTWSWRFSPPGLAEDSSQTARLRVSFPLPAPDLEGERRGAGKKIKKTNRRHSQAVVSSPPSHDNPKSDLTKLSFRWAAQGCLHWLKASGPCLDGDRAEAGVSGWIWVTLSTTCAHRVELLPFHESARKKRWQEIMSAKRKFGSDFTEMLKTDDNVSRTPALLTSRQKSVGRNTFTPDLTHSENKTSSCLFCKARADQHVWMWDDTRTFADLRTPMLLWQSIQNGRGRQRWTRPH